MHPFLDITKLSIAFPKSPLPVLREVDLKIERGEYVAVIGHSGCG
jgi:nitrate/nitrite transport system ATP-binding protein